MLDYMVDHLLVPSSRYGWTVMRLLQSSVRPSAIALQRCINRFLPRCLHSCKLKLAHAFGILELGNLWMNSLNSQVYLDTGMNEQEMDKSSMKFSHEILALAL